MNFPEAAQSEDCTLKLTDYEPIFPVTLQDFTDPASKLKSLTERPKLLKDLMHQMKNTQQEFLQREKVLPNS